MRDMRVSSAPARVSIPRRLNKRQIEAGKTGAEKLQISKMSVFERLRKVA